MSASFRDLFIELPRAVFEILQGAAEHAAMQIVPPAPRPRPRNQLYGMPGAIRHYGRLAYGWLEVDVQREANRQALTVVALLPCSHRHVITIDELAVIATVGIPNDFVEFLDRAVECSPRPCCCMIKEVA